jgi:hypothetical protein
MRLKQGAPICQALPSGFLEGFPWWLHQDVCVSEAASPNPTAVQHPKIPEWADLQDAKTTQRRRPQILEDVPVRLRKVFVVETLTTFQDQHGIAFFRQAHSGNAAAKTRPNDDEIIGFVGHIRPHFSPPVFQIHPTSVTVRN